MSLARIEAMEPRTLLSSTLLPDPSFGGGRVVLNAEEMVAFGESVHPLPDGDLLVAGRAFHRAANAAGQATHGVIVARYNADGSLDHAFGGRGWVFTERLSHAYALTAQPDGKVLVAGGYYPYTGRSDDDFASKFAAVRLNPEGSPDASFGGDGAVTVDFPGGMDRASDVALDPAGNIVLVGSTLVPPAPRTASVAAAPRALYTGTSRLAVARLTPAGAPDATFDGDGMAMPQAPGDNNGGSAVVTLAGGEIVAGGSGSGGAFVLKLRPDGSVDPSFGTGGATTLPRMEGVADLVLLADGDLAAVGEGIHDPPVDPRDPESVRNTPALVALARLNADGSPDAAFGSGGVVVEEARLTYYYFIDLALRELADGTLAVAGADYHYAYGALFGADGMKLKAAVSERTDFGGHPAVAIQADGKIVVCGHTVGTDPYAVVTARYVLTGEAPEVPEEPEAPADPKILSATFLGRPVRGGRYYLFRVVYRVADGFHVNTLRAPEGIVVDGPGGTSAARLLRHSPFRAGNLVVGLYRLEAPGGRFDAADAGTYTVRLGAPLAAQAAAGNTTAGTFEVRTRRRLGVAAALVATPK